jgi:AP-2 complex subunit alpha
VRKKAALCLLRLLRKTPADQAVVAADSFAPVLASLLEERDIGLLLATTTLLLGVLSRFGAGGWFSWSVALRAAGSRRGLLVRTLRAGAG